MIHNCLQGFEIMHIGNDSNLGKNDKICNILSSVAPPLLFFFFFFARVATFLYHQLFRTKGGSLRFFVFLLFSSILSASHSRSLAGASFESYPEVWENRSWCNSFHASWIYHFGPDDSLCQPRECEIRCDGLLWSFACRPSFILLHSLHHFFPSSSPSVSRSLSHRLSHSRAQSYFHVLVFTSVSQ